MIRTVTGDVDRLEGLILTHEHLQIDLTAEKGSHVVLGPDERDDVEADVRAAKELGFGAIVDVTAPEVGRNPPVLEGISCNTGLSILCSTGYYWEPRSSWALDAAVDELADRLVGELIHGIEGSTIRAGVIKIGNSKNEPDSVDARIFRAAALASRQTGAPIITHTSQPEQAFWQLDTLRSQGAALDRVLIGHLDRADEGLLLDAAEYGSFLGIDKISYTWQQTDEKRADFVKLAIDRGFGSQIIISSDVARKTRLAYHGGLSYSATWLSFVPLLRERGIDEATIQSILHDNPNRLLRWATE